MDANTEPPGLREANGADGAIGTSHLIFVL